VVVSHMTNVQEQKLARIKQTAQPKNFPELMAEGFNAGNSPSDSS